MCWLAERGWKISGIESLRLEARRFGSIRDPSVRAGLAISLGMTSFSK
jgi:hypothetical protein